MTLNKYDTLTKLDTTTYDWKCRVRAQTVWKGINRETQQCWGINIIFLDDSNNRTHAFINTKFTEIIGEDISEGSVYVLSNFKVKDYLGDETYRAVRNDKHIYFTENTKCVKDMTEGLKIEPYAFDLFAMDEIEKIADDNRFLIDIVGFVQNIRPKVTTVKNNVETRRFIFDISDGRSTIKVTLFNEFGDIYEHAFQEEDNEPVVIIMAAAKIGRYDGKINLTNYPATRIYVNPDHYSVKELKKNKKDMSMLDISSEEEEDTKNMISISEIQSLGNEFIQKHVHVQITVKRVDEKSTWYYARCAKCDIEVFRDSGRYKCTECKRIIPHPDKRFRVFTLSSDKTASIGIIFPDSEVRRIIGKSVFDIQADYIEEPIEDPFPDILKQFQHKEYIVTLLLNEDNIKNGSTVYEAVEVANGLEISANYSPSEQQITKAEDMSIINELESAVHPNETPQTGKSSNKSRARKTTGKVAYEQDANVPLKLYKNIKTEHK